MKDGKSSLIPLRTSISKYFLIYFLFLNLPCLFSKTLVFTTGFNRPDFIELQHRLFEKFLEDDYEFWVISDANTPKMKKEIQKKCSELGIKCINVPQKIHSKPYLPRSPGDNYNNPNVRHCNSVQWAWDNYFSHHEGPVMVIDSDMFLIRPFSIEKTLENTHLAGVLWGTSDQVTQKPYYYLWLALILFNNTLLPERHSICFNCGWLPNSKTVCDSGGWTGLYLKKFEGQLKLQSLEYLQGHEFYCPYRYASADVQNFKSISQKTISENLKKKGFSQDEINLALKKPYTIELLGGNHFLHYRAGTNYEGYSKEVLLSKDKILLDFFETILAK